MGSKVGQGPVERRRHAAGWLSGAVVACLLVPSSTWGDPPPPPLSGAAFIRIQRDADQRPLALETSIVQFSGKLENGEAVQVDLVAAVHLADRTYYQLLNERFGQQYDSVLYELVAPEGTRIPKGGPGSSANPLGATQQGMSGVLDLTFQLEEVDYTPEHFRHADLSPEEFTDSMRQRDESVVKMFFRMMGHAMANQTKDPLANGDLRIWRSLFSPNRSLELKRVMAEQMADVDQAIRIFEGEGGSTLIAVRNQRAIDVMQREIQEGKRRVAIFYGGAHMPDMATRLSNALPVQPAESIWLTAWDLRDSARE